MAAWKALQCLEECHADIRRARRDLPPCYDRDIVYVLDDLDKLIRPLRREMQNNFRRRRSRSRSRRRSRSRSGSRHYNNRKQHRPSSPPFPPPPPRGRSPPFAPRGRSPVPPTSTRPHAPPAALVQPLPSLPGAPPKFESGLFRRMAKSGGGIATLRKKQEKKDQPKESEKRKSLSPVRSRRHNKQESPERGEISPLQP